MAIPSPFSRGQAWTNRITSHVTRSLWSASLRVCARKGSYRLARIAAKYGPEISLRDLLDRFSYDCLWRTQSRTKKRENRLRRVSARFGTEATAGFAGRDGEAEIGEGLAADY